MKKSRVAVDGDPDFEKVRRNGPELGDACELTELIKLVKRLAFRRSSF